MLAMMLIKSPNQLQISCRYEVIMEIKKDVGISYLLIPVFGSRIAYSEDKQRDKPTPKEYY